MAQTGSIFVIVLCNIYWQVLQNLRLLESSIADPSIAFSLPTFHLEHQQILIVYSNCQTILLTLSFQIEHTVLLYWIAWWGSCLYFVCYYCLNFLILYVRYFEIQHGHVEIQKSQTRGSGPLRSFARLQIHALGVLQSMTQVQNPGHLLQFSLKSCWFFVDPKIN